MKHLNSMSKVALVASTCFFTFILVVAILLMFHWPYGDKNVRASLGKSFHGEVYIDSFQAVYWPNPGFIARGLTLRRTQDPAISPLLTAQSVIVAGRYFDLLTLRRRVRLVEIEGLRLLIPASGTHAREEDFPPGDGKDYSGPRTLLEVLHLHNSILEVQTEESPFILPVPDLLMQDVVRDHSTGFNVDVLLPRPSAAIHASGSLGPLHSSRLGEIGVSADFTISHADLSDIGVLRGSLNGRGSFHGILSATDLDATTETLDFAVKEGRPTPVIATVSATVNCLSSDIVLNAISAQTASTTVRATGTIIGKPKTANLNLTIVQGRIEDVMQPFLKGESPVAGELRLTSHATIRPATNHEKFLQRLLMDAHFTIPAESFTKPGTEEKLSAFSRRAQGLNPSSLAAKPSPARPGEPDVLLFVSGPIRLRNGIAQTSDLGVRMPGAIIHVAGTFNLHTQTAHLRGLLEMKSDLSHVTTGFKSNLLKPLAPLFKRHSDTNASVPTTTAIPISITGTRQFTVRSKLFGKR